jgi:hypothetical protein
MNVRRRPGLTTSDRSIFRPRPKLSLRWLWFLLCPLLLVAACQASGPDPCNPPGTLFADDFSGEQDCGWVFYDSGGASAKIEDGSMIVSTNQPGQIWWTNPGRQFSDGVISVRTQVVSGPDDNAYGVICRYQDNNNYYVFLISGDGFYAIGRYTAGSNQVTYLTGGGEYVPSDIINQGNSQNQMRVTCAENQLVLAVNGIELEAITDTAFTQGDIGLAVSTFQAGTLQVRFNDLEVVAP